MQTTKRTRRQRTAFTLIELLIVIAIICIIAAILFPVFESARDKARQSTCASNLKQIGMAMVMYASDNDEFYPRSNYYITETNAMTVPEYYPPTASGPYADDINYYHWWYWLVPYTKNSDIFFCPSRPLDANDSTSDTDTGLPTATDEWYNNGEITNAYLMNLSLVGAAYVIGSNGAANSSGTPGQIRDSFSGGNVAGVRETDATMMFCEGRGMVVPTLDTPWTDSYEVKSWPTAMKDYWDSVFYHFGANSSGAIAANDTPADLQANAAPHSGGLNVAYCDGHVKWLSVDQFLANCPNWKTDGDGSGTYLSGATLPLPSQANSNSGMSSYGSDAQATLKKDFPFWNLYAGQ